MQRLAPGLAAKDPDRLDQIWIWRRGPGRMGDVVSQAKERAGNGHNVALIAAG